jgi:hypothetical protein
MTSLMSLIILLLLLTPYSNAVQLKRKTTTSVDKSRNLKQPNHAFAKDPFDLSVDKLPSYYLGHSIITLYNALDKMVPQRSEYETGDNYLARLREQLGNELYAFKLPRDNVYLTYEADSNALQVWIVPSSVTASMLTKSVLEHDSSLYYGPNASSFTIWESPDRVSYYTASNGFGVRKRVSRALRSAYSVVDTKYTHDIKLHITMPPTKAIWIKPRVGALVIGKRAISPLRPLVNFSYVYHISPTLTEPQEYYVTYKCVVFDLQELWIFDTVSGEILTKEKLSASAR